MTENKVSEKPMCTAACKHACYIEDGDFFCDAADDVTIVSFCPFECPCPKKRKEAKE